MSVRLLMCFWLTCIPCWALAQQTENAELTLDRIFSTKEFREERVPHVTWLEDGAYLTLRTSKSHEHASDIVRFDSAGKSEILVSAEQLVPPHAREPLAIQGFEFSKDLDLVLLYVNSVKVWRQPTRGDYWSYRRSSGKLVKLGGDARPATLMFAKLSPDGRRVGYVYENNLYVEPVEGGTAAKLTSDGTLEIINGNFDWVYEEEFECRDGWRWSGDGRHIAYWQLDTRGMKTFTLVEGGTGSYPTLKTFAYPKTGERNAACRIGVVATAGGDTTWIDVPGDTRTDYYLPRMEWVADSAELSIFRVNRLQNSVDVFLADSRTGKTRNLLTERDGAWVEMQDGPLVWLTNGSEFAWVSERDGWRHLYAASRDGKQIRRITSGEFDVIRVLKIDEKQGVAYYLASPTNPTQQYLYRSALDGTGVPVRVTPADQAGWHDYKISEDGRFAIHTRSSFEEPPRSEFLSLPDHRAVRPLASNERLRAEVAKLTRSPVEFFRTELEDGTQLDGWLMKPADFDPAKKYPLVFYVYGEPAGQNVVDHWSGKRYLWHLMLTQQGYAVACVDNRGTPCPRGRDWRKSVYRRVGSLASEEQANAARQLLKRPYLDATRVGIWGWSGGGSMTLNQMFRHPDLYRTGMAIAPVPDMRLYDTIYQERYMGLPQENAEDYRRGSPVNFAEGLRGNLLIVHGTGDDNCHYHGTEKLVDRLIELNKHFTLMAYPNRSHSVDEGKNTSRHLYGLLTRFLQDNLPAGPRP